MSQRSRFGRCSGGLSRLATLSAVLFLLSSCSPDSSPREEESSNPLFVSPSSRDFSRNPELLDRVLASPHGYFRLINIPFSQEICRRFDDEIRGTPAFNLHGDAHLEQYAVTDLGRGLTDFDDSSKGPAVIDLMRFGVSVHLACDLNGWQSQGDELFAEFLRGYRAGLKDPTVDAPEPRVVAHLRSSFEYDRASYFEWIDEIMQPVPEREKAELLEASEPYVEAMLAEKPDLRPEFFRIEQIGSLKMGIGSALDRKYLFRIRGLSEDPGDDVVLELKQVRDLTGIDCIQTARGEDPFRILIGQSRIAYSPYELLGYLRHQGTPFWIHAWVDNYREVKLRETFSTPEELAEVAFDVGVQLGLGHPNQIAAPLDRQLRMEQLRRLETQAATVRKEAAELAELVIQAWERFRREAATL